MGYTNDFAQLMTVAPAVLSCIITITAGYVSGKTKMRRGVYTMLFCVLATLGYVLIISTHNSHVQYAGAFSVISGSVYSIIISG
jgi:predicted neutral ceramidase superfamily lipid hydrolase